MNLNFPKLSENDPSNPIKRIETHENVTSYKYIWHFLFEFNGSLNVVSLSISAIRLHVMKSFLWPVFTVGLFDISFILFYSYWDPSVRAFHVCFFGIYTEHTVDYLVLISVMLCGLKMGLMLWLFNSLPILPAGLLIYTVKRHFVCFPVRIYCFFPWCWRFSLLSCWLWCVFVFGVFNSSITVFTIVGDYLSFLTKMYIF